MLRARRFPLVRNRRGSALAVTGVSLIVIMGVMALVLDGGLLMAERRHAQSVADASALAAAYSLFNHYTLEKGLDPNGTAATIARAIASDNGYANDVTTSTVTVNIPPLSGMFLGKSGYAEVLVRYNLPRCFSAVLGAGTMSVTARTVARGISSPTSPAILLLDPHMPLALNAVGNGNATVTGGGSIVVNSNNAQAGNSVGNGNVSATNINFSGSYSASGNGQFVGTVKTYAAPTVDPLSRLPVPNPATMTVQSGSNYQIHTAGTYTLQPGVYTGGITITASSGTITLNPGVYYMQGGGFFDTGGIDVTGSGVTIYNAPTSTNDQVKLAGNGDVTLSPPTSGTYKGVSIFQDRTSTAVIDLTGNGAMSLSGTIYSAGAEVDLTGNGSISLLGSQIIANNLNVAGNGAVNVNYDPYLSPVRDTRIVR